MLSVIMLSVIILSVVVPSSLLLVLSSKDWPCPFRVEVVQSDKHSNLL